MIEVKPKMIYFITGASGVGKTSLVDLLETKYRNNPWAFLHFDKIGVPSAEEMVRDFGSGAKWQEAKTYEWIEKLVRTECEKVFFEGQVDLQFIRNGFSSQGYTTYTIILIDCSEDVMRDRLVRERGQPELFTPEMLNWLKYLRDQANAFNAIIINTSNLSKQELLQRFEERINLR